MKTLVSTLVLSLSLAGMSQAQTIIYSQDFENTGGVMPSEINIIDGDNCDVPSPNQANDYWRMIQRNGADTCLIVSSNFSQAPCTADDWLIFDAPIRIGSNSHLVYEIGTSLAVDYNIYVATAGATRADFLATTPLVNKVNYDTQTDFIKDTVSLAAYSGQDIYIAFRHMAVNKFEMYLDNIVVYNDTTVSVNQLNTTMFQCYPNPANAMLTIKLASAKESMLRVYNALGQEVYQAAVQNGQLDMNTSHLVAGMYTVSVQTGTTTKTERVLIQH